MTEPISENRPAGDVAGEDRKIRVMFVCLGNICRSPLAEGVFRETVRRAGLADRFEIHSSGTGDWHVGQGADRRMRATARRFGVTLEEHCARQFAADDLATYDHIFVMDKENLHDVLYLDAEERFVGKVRLFREFDPEPDDYQVPDPYFGGDEGFDRVYHIVERTSRRLVAALAQEHDLPVRDGDPT